jgi:nucleoside 2-deoxyribosyltransferase
MRTFYIAGPYKARTQYEREQNIRKAELVSIRILQWVPESAVICPHTMGRYWFEYAPEDAVLRMCIELLRRSDAVVLSTHVEECAHSEGTRAEVNTAINLGMPVFACAASITQNRSLYPVDLATRMGLV